MPVYWSVKRQAKTSAFGRRSFLKTACAAAAALALSAVMAPAVLADKAKETYSWTMGTTWPSQQSILGEAVARFSDRVKVMSNDRLSINIYNGGKTIEPDRVFDEVSKGNLQAASSVAFYQADRIPAAQWFASVPYGLNAQGMNAWLYSGGGLKLWEELYAPFNILPRPFGNTGVQMGGWFKKPIKHVEDFNGLKMRMTGLGAKVLEKAGAIPLPLKGNEIEKAFKTDKLDAVEWIGPLHDMAIGLHHIAKYYYYPGWHETGTCIELLINREAYNALPKDLQAIVDAAAAEINLWTLCEHESRNFAALSELVTKHDVKVKRYPESVLKTFRTYASEVLDEVSQKDPAARKVHESFKSYIEQKRNWDEISERPYYDSIDSKLKDLRRWMLPADPY